MEPYLSSETTSDTVGVGRGGEQTAQYEQQYYGRKHYEIKMAKNIINGIRN